MTLSREQFIYLLAQTGKGLDVAKVRAKWNAAYPHDQIEADDAVAYLSDRLRLVEAGMRPSMANEAILEHGVGYHMPKPRLSLRSRKPHRGSAEDA